MIQNPRKNKSCTFSQGVQRVRDKKFILNAGLILIMLLELVGNVFLLPIQQAKAGPDWLSGWDKRVKLTIDHNDIDNDLTNFPVLVYLSNSSGRDGPQDDLTCVFNEVETNSKKIAITSDNGTTQLYVEVENWSYDSGTPSNSKAWLWVKVPSIVSIADTDLYLYYDIDHAENTTYVGDKQSTPAKAVWDDNYQGVQHFNEASGTLYDSTSNNKNVTANGSPTYAEDSQIYKGIKYASEGIANRIDTSSAFDTQANDWTLEFWANYTQIADHQAIVWHQADAAGAWKEYITVDSTSNIMVWWQNGPTGVDTTVDMVWGAWHYWAFRYDDTALKLYIYKDGVLQNSGGFSADLGNADSQAKWAHFNRWDATAQGGQGTLDEWRFSPTLRPESYVKASYESERDNLLDFGSEEIGNQAPKKIEQQINIIDQATTTAVTSYLPTDNRLGLVYWDASKYNGATVYFEAVIRCNGGSGCSGDYYYAALFSESGIQITNSEVSSNYNVGNIWLRLRSSELTLGSLPNLQTNTKYTAKVKHGGAGNMQIQSARLIIVQSASSITDTQTQIEIGAATSTSATASTTLQDPKYFYYDSSKFSPDPSATATFQATMKFAESPTNNAYTSAATTTNWQVPTGVTSLTVRVWGAGGGSGAGGDNAVGGIGGGGGFVKDTVSVTPGDYYTIVVGGGGKGGTKAADAAYDGAGGGGAGHSAFIRQSDNTYLLIGGGGGGGGAGSENGDDGGDGGTGGTHSTAGQSGGRGTGGAAGNNNATGTGGCGGGGGTSSGVGAGGSCLAASNDGTAGSTKWGGPAGSAGSDYAGGAGGVPGAGATGGNAGAAEDLPGGGGGAGGRYGGGGGEAGNATNDIAAGGGGGGSGLCSDGTCAAEEAGSTTSPGNTSERATYCSATSGNGGAEAAKEIAGNNGAAGCVVISYTSPGTAYAQLYNKTDGTYVAGSLVATTSSNYVLATSSSFTLTSGKEYAVSINASGGTVYIANAKIVLTQTGTISKLQTVQQYINALQAQATATYTAKDFDNQFNPNNFQGGELKYFFEATIKTSAGTGYARLWDETNSKQLAELTTAGTSYTRQRTDNFSSASSTPTAASTLDTQLKNSATNTTSVASSWLIVEISNLVDSTLTQSGYRWFANSDIEEGGGEIDTSWGTSGSTTLNSAGAQSDKAFAIALDNNRNIYAAGYASSTSQSHNFWVVKLNSSGAVDTSWGSNGSTSINSAGTQKDVALSVALDSDRNVYVGGYRYDNGNDYNFWVVKLNSSGAVDTSWGTNGSTTLNSGGTQSDVLYSLVLDSDRNVYAGGYQGINGNDFWAVKLNSSGAVDTSWGTNGSTTLNSEGTSNNQIRALALDSDRNVYAAVFRDDGTGFYFDFWVVKLNSSGAVDTSWGSNGSTTINSGGNQQDISYALALDSNRNVYVGGYQTTGDADFWIVKLNSSGAVDTSWGNNGSTTLNSGGAQGDWPYALVLDSSNNVYVGGCQQTGDYDFWVVKLNSSGAVDTSWGTNGSTTLNSGGTQDDVVYGLALDSSRNVYAGGFQNNSAASDDMWVVKLSGSGAMIGEPMAAVNATTTLSSSGQSFRLRMLIHATNYDLYSGTTTPEFKLQHASTTGSNCASPTGTWIDVTGSTEIAYKDNPALVDKDLVWATTTDPINSTNLIIHETYEEANNFLATTTVYSGQDGLWDFSLYENGTASTTYCFRAVKSDDTALTYNYYPAVNGLPPPTLNQSGYRWFENSDSGGFAVTSNPSANSDVANAIATSTNGYFYTAGYDASNGSSDYQWRIEKRSMTTGNLVYATTSNPSVSNDVINAMALDSTYLYVAGYDRQEVDDQWRIEKRSLADETLSYATTTNPSGNGTTEAVNGIAVDSQYMYVIGDDYSQGIGNNQWRIEKRYSETGLLDTSFGTNGATTSNPSTNSDKINAIAIDSQYMYVVGDSAEAGTSQWRIHKINKSTGNLEWATTTNPSDYDDVANAIATDATFMYIVGSDGENINNQWRIEKRYLSNGLLDTSFGTNGATTSNPTTNNDVLKSIAIDSTYMYVAGYVNDAAEQNGYWRIEKRNLSDGSLVSSVISNPTGNETEKANAVAIDSTHMYVAGYGSLTSLQWRIEKRSLSNLELGAEVGLPLTSSQNATTTLTSAGQEFRLRMLLHVSGNDLSPGAQNYKLQYASTTGTNCSSPSGTWTNVTYNTEIAYKDNSTLIDGQLVAATSTDPTHQEHTRVYQTYEELNNFTATSTIANGQDGLWDFSLQEYNSVSGLIYCLRAVQSNNTELDTYTYYPAVITTTSSYEQSAFRWFANSNTYEGGGELSGGWGTSGNGTSTYNSGGTQADLIRAITIDSDRNIYVAGNQSTNGNDWLIAKYTSSGVLASGWGTSGNGTSTYDSGGVQADYARAITIDSDRNIYVAGSQLTNSGDWLIAKYTSAGVLASGWGTSGNGTSTYNSGGTQADYARAITIDSDRNIYVAGYQATNGNDWLIAKYTSSGVLASGWGTSGNGTSTYNSGGTQYDVAYAITIDSDRNIYVAGYQATNGNDWLIAKYTSAGVLASGWGTSGNGTSTYDSGAGLDEAYAITIDSDRNIYVAGEQATNGSDWLVAKYTSSGVLASGWGTSGNGTSTYNSGGTQIDSAYAITIDSDRNIYVAGYASTSLAYDWLIAKYTSSGVLASGWGTSGNGTSTYDSGGVQADYAQAITIDSDRNIYVAGYQQTNGNDWLIAKYQGGGAVIGEPLAVANSTTTLTSAGQEFRLRMLIHASGNNLGTSQQFKLQHASTTGTNCASPSSGTWVDVTGSTKIAYKDNPALVDQDLAQATSTDPTHSTDLIVHETYEELNNFNATTTVYVSQDGLWDFSLYDNGAPANTTYCLRAVESNDTAFASYTYYPAVIIYGAPTVSCSSAPDSVDFNGLTTLAVHTTTDNATTTISCTAIGGCNLIVYDLGTGSIPGIASTTNSAIYIPSPNANYATDATSTLQEGVEGYGIKGATTSAGTGQELLMTNMRYNRYHLELYGANTVGGLEQGSGNQLQIASSTGTFDSKQIITYHKAAVETNTEGGAYQDTIYYNCTGN